MSDRTAAELGAALDAERLTLLGIAPADPGFCPPETRCIALVGPQGGDRWWRHVTAASEWRDAVADPIDRWSARVLGALAARFGGHALFPSDGPPWPPFFRWAQQTGRAWPSPVGMLVHAEAGLWLSFRGALALPFPVDLPPAPKPCDACADQPCRNACPVGALSQSAYDTAACHGFLDMASGADCLSRGCAARRACPVSQSHARLPEQSAYHMSRFHP